VKFLLNLYLNVADLPAEGFDHEVFLATAGRQGN
jgi:hypothetical protein